MGFDWWRRLTDDEKLEIAARAKAAQDATGRHICYWCGAMLTSGGYDYASSARDSREICKGYCRNRRFFDDPE